MRAHTQGVCGSRIATRLNYSSLLLLLIIRPVTRKEKPCWLSLHWTQKQKKLSICPLATSLKDVTWAERKHWASQQSARGRRQLWATQLLPSADADHPLQTGQPSGDTNTQCIHSYTYLLPIGLEEEEVQRCVWPLQEVLEERQQGSTGQVLDNIILTVASKPKYYCYVDR